MNFVIIGFGVAAYWAIKTLLAEDNGCFYFTIITPECKHFCYKSFFGNYLLSSAAEDMPYPYEIIQSSENINFMFGKYVTSLKPDSQCVTLNTGETIFYDALLIASGAGCSINSSINTSVNGVFRFDSIDSVLNLRSYLSSGKKKAVIFGENYYAFEMTRTLLKLGMEVSIVCEGDYPCQRFLSKDIVDFALRSLVFEARVIPNNLIKKIITHNNSVSAVALTDGDIIDTDIVGLCKDIYPKTDFLAEYKDNRGKIIVDNYMCTQMPGVYAAGDAAIVENEPYTLSYGWLRAHTQGKIVAYNLLGKTKKYSLIPSLRMQILYNPLIILGQTVDETKQSSISRYTYKNDVMGIYRSVVIKDKKIINALFCGDLSNTAVIEELMSSNQEINDISEIEFYLKIDDKTENLSSTKFCPFCKTALDFINKIDNGTVFTCPVCYVDLKILKHNNLSELIPKVM
ncbi:FAD-dependent oxidoreductase [bacterium]|nr:FAD-dependent oxidoreductase [bacterium]